MIYTNTKLNHIYSYFNKYGKDTMYKRKSTKVLGSTMYNKIMYKIYLTNSSLGMYQQIKSITGNLGFFYTRLYGNNEIAYSSD